MAQVREIVSSVGQEKRAQRLRAVVYKVSVVYYHYSTGKEVCRQIGVSELLTVREALVVTM